MDEENNNSRLIEVVFEEENPFNVMSKDLVLLNRLRSKGFFPDRFEGEYSGESKFTTRGKYYFFDGKGAPTREEVIPLLENMYTINLRCLTGREYKK